MDCEDVLRGARILWCVTGAGCFLRECLSTALRIRRRGAKITLFFTRMGYRVARIYGCLGLARAIAWGGSYEELIVEGDELALNLYGRVGRKRYQVVVVAPATAAFMSKASRLAADDTVVSIAVQALRSRVPLIVLPTDPGFPVETELPVTVSDECRGCTECPPQIACPTGALVRRSDGKVTIMLSECVGCEKCVNLCPHGAIKARRKARVEPLPLDAEHVYRLSSLGARVVVKPEDLEKAVEEALRGPRHQPPRAM